MKQLADKEKLSKYDNGSEIENRIW